MRDHGTETVRTAYLEGWAVGAFSTYTLELTQAIVGAAEEAYLPVMIQAGASAFAHAGFADLAAQAVFAADRADVRVGVHLDHCRDLEQIKACLDMGYTSVMVDGSHLGFEENIALSRAAVAAARPHGAWVEAELGSVPGDEDRSTEAAASDFTDPARAEQFVARTGVDALAVAIGNVHGTATPSRALDLALLSRLRNVIAVPLVLHGASGLPAHELVAARALGVAKVNVNTQLRTAFLDAIAAALPETRPSADLATTLGRGRTAVQEVVRATILALTAGTRGGAAAVP